VSASAPSAFRIFGRSGLITAQVEDAAPGSELSREEQARAYFVCGGIPAYLQRLDPHRSVLQNLAHECFELDGFFMREPDFSVAGARRGQPLTGRVRSSRSSLYTREAR